MKCTECGKEISDSAERCPSCGCKTNRGKTVEQRKLLLVRLIFAVILEIVGAILFFTALSEMKDISSYYWQSGAWVEKPKAFWAVCKVAMGPALFLGGLIDTLIICRKAHQVNNYETTVVPKNPYQDSTPAVVPENKQKSGNCAICNSRGIVASCKIPYQFGTRDLCPMCIRKYNAQIIE